jgi:F0F1-type ATP synthase assembly protein I
MTPSEPPPARQPDTLGGRDAHRRAVWGDLDQSAVMTVELVVAVLLYGGLGFLADGWLGTGPWLASIGTLVGLGAGLYLVWMRSERAGQAPRDDTWEARR